MATTTVRIRNPKSKTQIVVPGQTIFLSKGIEHYELGDAGVDIYGNSGERVKIEDDKIVVYYDKKDELGSFALFTVEPRINAEALVARLDALGVPEGRGASNPVTFDASGNAIPSQIIKQPEEPTNAPFNGKGRTRKTKRRRTLRKHK